LLVMRTPVAKMMMSVVNQSSIFMGRNVSVDCCMLVLIVLFFLHPEVARQPRRNILGSQPHALAGTWLLPGCPLPPSDDAGRRLASQTSFSSSAGVSKRGFVHLSTAAPRQTFSGSLVPQKRVSSNLCAAEYSNNKCRHNDLHLYEALS